MRRYFIFDNGKTQILYVNSEFLHFIIVKAYAIVVFFIMLVVYLMLNIGKNLFILSIKFLFVYIYIYFYIYIYVIFGLI